MSESKDIASVEEVVRELREMRASYVPALAGSRAYERIEVIDRAVRLLLSLSALEKDAARLDWLEAMARGEVVMHDIHGLWNIYRHGGDIKEQPTLRTAIDLARGQS